MTFYAALLRLGKEHHFDRLLQLMKQQHKAKVDTLGGKTKGHFISLDNGGLDVAENFGPQAGKSRFKIVNGKKQRYRGNYSEQADSTVGFGANKGVSSWDDYVRMKLSEFRMTDVLTSLQSDFKLFLQALWDQLDLPSPTRAQYAIADYLQHGPKRLQIQAFRGVGKSWITGAFVLWTLFNDAEKK